MSTFEQLSKLPGVGVLFYFDISIDKGVTYTKAYSTQWYFGGSYQTEPRIVSLGNLTRRLGADRGFTAATIDCVLENTDGGVDWVCDQSTFAAQAMGSVWKLHCILYDPSNTSDLAGMVCGVFSLMDPPTRNASTVSLKLVDGGLGIVSQMSATPTIRDWVNITDANRPAYLTPTNLDDLSIIGSVPNYDFDAPTPLMFGNNQFPIRRCFQNCYVICAVPGAPGVLPTSLDFVRTNTGLSIPRQMSGPGLSVPLNVWTVRRTPTITKNGKSWHLLWVDLDLNNDANLVTGPGTGDDSLTRNFLGQFYELKDTDQLFRRYGIHELIGPVTVQGGLMSHPANDLAYTGTPALTIVQDLLTYCLPTAITIETDTSISATRSMTWASGSIIQGVQEATSTGGARFMELTDGDMPKALRQICAVGDFDLFFTWAGNARVAAMAEDYESQTEAITTLPEEMMAQVSERIPSVGERNAPVNRTFVNVRGTRYGPIDDAPAIAEWGRVVSREVDGSWLPDAPVLMNDGERGVWVVRPRIDRFRVNGQSVVRPVLSVVTGLNGLNLDLADYVKVTWSRGTIGGPYLDAIFRVEGIALAPLDGKVQLELVWCDDLREPGNLPYILDDEDEYLVVAASGGRTCELTDGSAIVEFSSGDLFADGVALGDVLIVQDATESATAFKRNRSLIIVNISAADTLEVDVSDFGSGGPFTITTWKIVNGADTTGRATYYGKTCTVLGQFYNLGEANRLLEG